MGCQRGYNPVVVVQNSQDVTLTSDQMQQPAGTVQVAYNSEIPPTLQDNPPAGVSVQTTYIIPPKSP